MWNEYWITQNRCSKGQTIINASKKLKNLFSQESINPLIVERLRLLQSVGHKNVDSSKSREFGKVQTPYKTSRETSYVHARNVKFNDFVKSAIGRIIRRYFLNNRFSTMFEVLCIVNLDPQFPDIKTLPFIYH